VERSFSAVLAMVQRAIIAKEDHYLERRFGEEYPRYTGWLRR
jgi:protein-S-isoprenylcysteine O-methyltransferase Ste14